MATAVKEIAAPAGEYLLAPIGIVEVDKNFNNRRELGDVKELADSIRSVGLLEPLLVWRRELGAAATDPSLKGRGFLHVIAGHRRLAAAKLAGLAHVPVIVVDLDEKSRLEALLVENLHRLGIDPLEEADGYKRLLAFGLTQAAIAAKVGRSPAHVSKRLSLLELPKEATDLVLAGKLAIADVLELTPYLKEPVVIAETMKAVKEAIRNGWGFRVDGHARGAKRRLEQERKVAAIKEKLKAEKVSVLSYDGYGHPSGSTLLGTGYGELPIKVAEHAKGGCHAAFLDHQGDVHYVCTKLANHKASTDKVVARAVKALTTRNGYGGASANKAQAKKAAESRERNKVLREREPIRSSALKNALNAKQKREDVVDFVLRQLLQRFLDESHEVEDLAAALLSVPSKPTKHSYQRATIDWATWLSGGKDRVFKLAYAISLASGELPFRHLLKQGYFDSEYGANAGRYIAHLKDHGYKPDKVELEQLGKPANAYQWRSGFDQATTKEKKK